MSVGKHSQNTFYPDEDFIFLKRMVFGDGEVMPGDPVPKGLMNKAKLRAFWKARAIGYASLAKTPDKRPVVSADKLGGGWYKVTLPDGSKKKVRKKDLDLYIVREVT